MHGPEIMAQYAKIWYDPVSKYRIVYQSEYFVSILSVSGSIYMYVQLVLQCICTAIRTTYAAMYITHILYSVCRFIMWGSTRAFKNAIYNWQ